MKKNATISLVLFFVSCFVFTSNAQVSDSNLSKKFSTLFNNSSSYQNYKLVNKEDALNFQNYLQNYVHHEQTNQLAIKNKLIENEKELLVLQQEMTELMNINQMLIQDSASVSFFGMAISRETYSVFVWTLFLGLLLFSLGMYYRYKKANEVTESSKMVLQELEDEYESFRRVCIEREQSLRRQLFDEIKKSNELRDAS